MRLSEGSMCVHQRARPHRSIPLLRVLCAGTNPLQQWGGEDEVFSHLIQGGQTAGAVALAHACWRGTELTAALERALAGLAARCARLQTSGHGEREAGADLVADDRLVRPLLFLS